MRSGLLHFALQARHVSKTVREQPIRPQAFGMGVETRSSDEATGLSASCAYMGMGQNPNRTPSEHPNPTTKLGSKMGGEFTSQPKWIPLVLTHSHQFGPDPHAELVFPQRSLYLVQLRPAAPLNSEAGGGLCKRSRRGNLWLPKLRMVATSSWAPPKKPWLLMLPLEAERSKGWLWASEIPKILE